MIKNPVTQLLEESYKLMNDEGRHWVKGIYKAKIERVHQSTKELLAVFTDVFNLEQPEFCYCTSGAVREVAWKKNSNYSEEDAKKAFEYLATAAKFTISEEIISYWSSTWDDLNKVIYVNDHKLTTWKDMTNWFNKAIELSKENNV